MIVIGAALAVALAVQAFEFVAVMTRGWAAFYTSCVSLFPSVATKDRESAEVYMKTERRDGKAVGQATRLALAMERRATDARLPNDMVSRPILTGLVQ